MQNLLIIDKKLEYIQKIMYGISNNINNVKTYCFYLEKNNEIIELITNNEVDIIIINVEVDKMNILEYICKNNIQIYNKSIIILYNDIKLLKSLLKAEYEQYIFKCVKIKENIDNLLEILHKLAYIKENNYEKLFLENKINRILIKIGFKLHCIGTKYITEIIQYISYNNIKEFDLNKIYVMLSKKYHKSENTIKGNIRDACDNMKQHLENENKIFIIDYFNYLELKKLPTPKEIISTINSKL